MQQSHLLHLLRKCNTRERTRFREYVASPFFNKHHKLKELLDYLLQSAPHFQTPALEKTLVFAHLYGAEPYDEFRINNLISDLLQLYYDYLAFRAYDEKKSLQQSLLVSALLEREEWQLAERQLKKWKDLQSKTSLRHFQYFDDLYEFHESSDILFLSKARREYDPHLQEKSAALDHSYALNKLRIACDMASRNVVTNSQYACRLLDSLLNAFAGDPGLPVFEVYRKTLLMLQNEGDERHYFELKELLSEHLSAIPNDELNTLYQYALNYCIRQINSGQTRYYPEILDLYRVLLERRIIFRNGSLSHWTYKNIITVAIRLGEFNWAETFIHQYRNHLQEDVRHNAFAYNIASLCYARKDYAAALRHLHNVEFSDPSYHLGAKIIQLKSYYELDEEEPFYSLSDAFRQYIRRHGELSDYGKKANLHFLKMAQRVFQLRNKQNILSDAAFRKERDDLYLRINTLDPLANKDWLCDCMKGF